MGAAVPTSGPYPELPAPTDWLDSERWAYDCIMRGQPADFEGKYGKLDPTERAGWGTERELRDMFVQLLLCRESIHSLIPAHGLAAVASGENRQSC
jgi:hypothetical protein